MGGKFNTPYPGANEYVTNIWQARWNALKEVVDRDRKRARKQLDLEFPALDNIYRAMLNLEQVGDFPNPHTPLRVGMEPDYLACARCGKRDATVRRRICAFSQQVYGEEIEETICDECEDTHRKEVK